MKFSTIIRDARTAIGLSQTDLAIRAGLGIATVWRLEKDCDGTVDVLARLCTALDLRFAGLPRGRGFGEQVRIMRSRRRWSHERLAERAGVSAPAIARLEGGNARIATLTAVLDVLAPTVRVRRVEVAQWGGGSRDRRFTPPDVLALIEAVIGVIDLDPSAHPESPVVATLRYFEEDDGLSKTWAAETVYVNPPYSGGSAFIRKAFESWRKKQCRVVLMLLPVQTHTVTFHECVIGHADVFLLRGRIAFVGPSGSKKEAPFPSMIVIYGADSPMINRMLSTFDCVYLPRSAAVGRAVRRMVREAAE